MVRKAFEQAQTNYPAQLLGFTSYLTLWPLDLLCYKIT